MTKTRFFRIYRIVLAVVLAGMLIPTLALSPYARPIMDDVWQPLPVARTWRETGSVLQTAKAAVQEVVNIYHDYSGIFFGMFLMVIPFSVFGNQFLFLNVILTVLLLICAMWRLAWCARYICKDVPKEVLHCFALLMSILVFLLMPSYYEAFYWFTASVNYIGIFSVSIFLFSALFRGVATGEMPVWKLVLLCVGFFLMGGGNWNSCTSAIVIYGGFALAILFLRKPRRLLIPYLFLVAGYMVNVFSPGNANRVTWNGKGTGNLIEALINSFLKAAQFVFRDSRIWIFAILLLPVLWELCRRSKLSFRMPALVPVYSLCVLASAFFPMLFANYEICTRHINLIFLLLVSLLPWNLLVFMGWIQKQLKINCPPDWQRTFVTIMCAAVLMIGMTSFDQPRISDCSLQPVKAMVHWVDGHARYWAEYYDWVMELTLTSPDRDVEIPLSRFVTDELMSPLAVVTDDPEHWINQAFAKYYGGDDYTIKIVP